ncbi:MAG: FAD-dependent oxidoreductase [Firmicutes bacterium]|nr:FAD-dependent oxidoreductase [Bacillota bacterium]
MALKRTQVLIVGGGMVGLALACALSKAGRDVVVVERQPRDGQYPEQPTLRVSAINLGAQRWLTELGAWVPAERSCQYQGMDVWDADSFGRIEFNAASADLPHLGTIVENAVVEAALWQAAEKLGVTLISGVQVNAPEFHEQDVTVQLDNGDLILAQLLVAADGANSALRAQVATPVIHRDYEQHGLVATIRSSEPHQGVARQVFLPGGPLALLPLADPHSLSIVWSLPINEAKALCALNPEEFNQQLTVASDNRLGLLECVSERVSFPLTMRYAQEWIYQRQVLVGDAAHTIHPLAGQGVNLGFADAHLLAELLNGLGTLNGQWDAQQLQRQLRHYQRARKTAALRHIATMESFHQLFRPTNPLLKLARGVGLKMADRMNPLKDFFLQQANKLD